MTFLGRQKKKIENAKTERILDQHTYITVNIKVSSTGRKKMLPDRNLNLHKRLERVEVVTTLCKHRDFLLLLFQSLQKDILFRAKMMTM